MRSPKAVSSAYTNKWAESPNSRRVRHGRQDLSPVPPAPVEPVPETRRILLKRKTSPSVDQPGSEYASRVIKDFLKNDEHNDNGPAPKRPKSSVVVVPKNIPPKPTLDRKSTCPILIRVFYSTDGRHTPISAFSTRKLPPNEVHVNAWLDTSLKELSHDLIYAVKSKQGGQLSGRGPPLRLGRPIRFHFTSIYPDPIQRGAYRKRDLGSYILSPRVNNEEEDKTALSDADVTLESKHFQVGDFLDVVISNFDETRDEANRGNYRRQIQERSEAVRF